MDLIMIRHTSVGVPRGTCYGWTDVPVADTFEQEAAETLRDLQPLMPFDRVYSSPLTRARMLAEYYMRREGGKEKNSDPLSISQEQLSIVNYLRPAAEGDEHGRLGDATVRKHQRP